MGSVRVVCRDHRSKLGIGGFLLPFSRIPSGASARRIRCPLYRITVATKVALGVRCTRVVWEWSHNRRAPVICRFISIHWIYNKFASGIISFVMHMVYVVTEPDLKVLSGSRFEVSTRYKCSFRNFPIGGSGSISINTGCVRNPSYSFKVYRNQTFLAWQRNVETVVGGRTSLAFIFLPSRELVLPFYTTCNL
jgi:hypothetical protein